MRSDNTYRYASTYLAALLLLVIIAIVIALIPTASHSQSGYNAARSYTFTATGSDITLQQNTLILYHQLSWTDSNVSTCAVTLDTSPDGVNWTTGGLIASQNCATNGNSVITSGSANYIRITVATLTGTSPSVTIQYEGWAYNPSGAGVSNVTNTPAANQLLNSTSTTAAQWTSAINLGGSGDGSGSVVFGGNTSGTQTLACNGATCTVLSLTGSLSISGTSNALKYNTTNNCNTTSTTTSPATCSTYTAGVIAAAASATTFTVNTSNVQTTSRIFLSYDTHSTNCTTAPSNIASMIPPYVSSLSAGTSFTMTFPVAPSTNPICVEFFYVN